MQKKSVGRPKKQNAVRSGQVKNGERRYTFITTEENVTRIKQGAKKSSVSIKEYLNIILNCYWESNNKLNNNETLLENFLTKRISG